MPNVGKLYGYRDSSANPSLIYSTDSVVDMYSTFYDNTGAKHNNIVVTSIDQDDSFSIGQVNIVNTYISGHTNDGTAEFIYEDTYGRCYTLNNGIYTIIPAGQANKGLYAYYVRWYSKWKIFGNTTFGYRHFYFDWDFTHSVERDVYTFRGMDNNYTIQQHIDKVRGLLDDLETLLEAMDDLANADNDGSWLLNYLRNETQTMQTLSRKKDFTLGEIARLANEISRIVNEMQEL